MNAIALSTVGHTGTNACGDCVRPQSNEAVIIETRSPHFYKWWEQVTMMDIDLFKVYNDTYGHIAGDHVIESIADVLRRQVKRRVDIIARYGGEEFSAVLQDVTYEQAKVLCYGILEGVESLGIVHSGSEYGHVTISIGLYFGPVYPRQKIEDLINYADQALYLAKNNGRNRLECLPGA